MTRTIDPLGLTRCASCGNAFAYDRLPDGRCRVCGGRFDGETGKATHINPPTLEGVILDALAAVGHPLLEMGHATLNNGVECIRVSLPWDDPGEGDRLLEALYSALPDWVTGDLTDEGPEPDGDGHTWRDAFFTERTKWVNHG